MTFARSLIAGLALLVLTAGSAFAQCGTTAPANKFCGNDTGAQGLATWRSVPTGALSSIPGGTVLGNRGSGSAAPAAVTNPVLGIPGTSTGEIDFAGSTSGAAVLRAQAVAGSAVVLMPTAAGTLVGSAAAPLAINATTGQASITGLVGGVLAGAGPAFTISPVLGVAGSSQGSLGFAGATSGTVTVRAQAAAGTTTFTLPNASGTAAVSASAPLVLNATTGALTITSAALTKTDDTNVTMTLGGTPASALIAATSLTLGWTGQLSVARGGTGIASGTSGGIPYFNSGSTLASSGVLGLNQIVFGGGAAGAPATGLGLGTTATVLHGNAAGLPAWGAVSLASDVSNILPTANGGTGVNNTTNNAGDVLSSSGTNGTFATRSLNALCTLAPSVCNLALGYTSIYWYGAKCDGIYQSNQNFDQPATNISITSGLKVLTSSGSTFTSADVGKRVWIPFGGPAGADYGSTITGFTNATTVTVNDAASTTVTAQAATNTHPFAYGTDDTTAIQAAMTGVPFGGTLYIPGSRTGCVIRQQGANTYSLLQNKPFTIRGDGHFSNLMTFPDIPSTVDNLFVDGTGGYDWTNISWSGFSIGMSPSFIPPAFIMYKRYGKRGLVLSGDFAAANIDSMMLGESGNDYSLHIGSASGGSQAINITRNRIYGGLHLANVSDSFRIQSNLLFGASIFGGLFELVGGAGDMNFSNNNVTWAGCTIFENGTKMIVAFNYFEEVLNPSSCARNAMVDFNGGGGTIVMPSFYSNIINASVSTTSTPVRYSNVTGGSFGDNFLTTSTARTFVTSVATMSCAYAPNFWNGGGTHFSTALANTYAGC